MAEEDLYDKKEIPLNTFYAEIYSQFSPSEKRRAVVALGRSLGTLAFQGECCALSQLKVVSVLGEWTFVSAGAGSADRSSDEILSGFYSYFLFSASRCERFRFLYSFDKGTTSHTKDKNRLGQLEHQACQRAERRWKSLEKQCLKSNEKFLRKTRSNLKVWCRNTQEAHRILGVMLSDLEGVFSQGEAFSGRGTGCSSVKVLIEGRSYFLKLYHCRGGRARFKSLFRESRAHKVWRTTWSFIARGLPVPEPLVYLEERRFGVLMRSYILSEFREGTTRLMDLWPRLDLVRRKYFLAKSAVLLGRMHRFNCIHGDTNWDNILVGGSAGREKLLMVDLDCGRRAQVLSRKRAQRDLSHFIRDMKREKNSATELVPFFLSVWNRWY